MAWSTRDIPELDGHVAVVTGGNGGLGLATVKGLAGAGAHVVMAARNEDKAAKALQAVLDLHPDASVEVVALDLASLASVKAAAEEVRAHHDRLDILVNNAGVMAMPQVTTQDGFDMQFGVNHLGHWALTSHLLPLVVTTPGSRVVTVSSTAQHSGSPVDPDDPHMREGFDSWAMYGQSKLANRHFATGLAVQFDRAGVHASSLASHPGLTNSDLQARTVREGGGGRGGELSQWLVARVGMDEDRGALSQLRAATDPKAPNGGFYGPLWGTAGPPVRKPLVRPGEAAAIETLWEVSRAETGLDVDVPQALAAASAA